MRHNSVYLDFAYCSDCRFTRAIMHLPERCDECYKHWITLGDDSVDPPLHFEPKKPLAKEIIRG